MNPTQRDTRTDLFVVKSFEGEIDWQNLRWKILFALFVHNVAQVAGALHNVAAAIRESKSS